MGCDVGGTLERAVEDAGTAVIAAESAEGNILGEAAVEYAHSEFNQAITNLVFHRGQCLTCKNMERK